MHVARSSGLCVRVLERFGLSVDPGEFAVDLVVAAAVSDPHGEIER